MPPPEHQFKPNWKGGPGRPKKKPFKEAIERAIAQGRHSLDAVVDDLFQQSTKGNVAAIKEIRETLDGRSLAIGGDDDADPIRVDVSGLSTDALRAIIAESEKTDQD